jgi:thiosulfate reductase cytochrome b subunit
VSGLAMSPAFNSGVPWCVNVLGGRQSARTVHFVVSVSLVLFLVIHVLMVALSGFASRMREMIGGTGGHEERA